VLTIERLIPGFENPADTASRLAPGRPDGKIILRKWRGLDVVSAVVRDDGGFTNYIYQ